MANSEKGHAKNVANFGNLTSYAASLGKEYNPSNQDITLEALQAMYQQADKSLSTVNTAIITYKNAVSKRRTMFKPLNKLITKVGSSYKSSKATKEDKNNLLNIAKKLKGIRISTKLTAEQKKELEGNGEEKKQISAAQTGFDNKIQHLDMIVKLLAANPLYAPNEEQLKTASLEALHNELKAMNTEAFEATTALINARAERNKIMYAENTGLISITTLVKEYIKSIDSISGPKFKAISKLSFVDVK